MSVPKNSLSRTTGLIVAYRTDPRRLELILSRLAPHCSVVICDNSECVQDGGLISECADGHGAVYLSMGDNVGIARAQNVGVAYCWEHGAERVLLLDDDSLPCAAIVAKLESALERTAPGLAVVGARALYDGRDISNARPAGDLTPCRELMSSGTLISRRVFDLVGPFDESLFIDGVDFDWGWRAQARGVRLYLSAEATMEHRLGIGQINLGPLRIRIPASVRHYYQFRNVIRLMTRAHTPWRWRFGQAVRLPAKFALVAIVAPRRRERVAYAIAGIRDALVGRTGKMDTAK